MSTEAMICQQCQAQFMEGTRFCPQRGTPVPQPPVGNVAHGNQEYQEAIEHYTEAIHLDPNNALVYGNRGLAYYFLGQRQRAIQDFDKAIQLDPDAALAYGNRGLAYSDLGEHQRAIRDYNKAIQLGTNDAFAYALRHRIGQAVGKLTD